MVMQRPPTHRRRGQELQDALIDAAWLELTATGYSRLTMEAVAIRAGTSKAVLYRRWSNRAELILAALRKHAAVNMELPDTGTLRGDIIAVLRWLADRYRDFPETVHGLMVELPGAGPVSQTSVIAMRAVLQRWVQRGKIDLTKVTSRIVNLPLDLARYEMFVSKRPLSEAAIEEIADEVFIPLLQIASRCLKP